MPVCLFHNPACSKSRATLALHESEPDEGQLLDAMAAHPRLIERPIVVAGDRAAIGRPPENVLAIL